MSFVPMIVRSDATLSVRFTKEAEEMKTSALEQSALVGRVTNPDEQNTAVAAQMELKRAIKLAEDSRVECKAPVLEYGKRIDDAAKLYKAELQEEEFRIIRLVEDFQALEKAKVRAAEAAKAAEIRKMEAEKAAKEAEIRAEEARKQKELDEQAAKLRREQAEATSAKAKAKLAEEQAELDRQRALSEAKSHEALDKINEDHCDRVAALPTVEAARAEGQVVKEDWEIVVVNVWELARAHPMCVKVEPRLSEIKNLLDCGVKVSGVTAKRVPKASVRLSREQKAIEV